MGVFTPQKLAHITLSLFLPKSGCSAFFTTLQPSSLEKALEEEMHWEVLVLLSSVITALHQEFLTNPVRMFLPNIDRAWDLSWGDIKSGSIFAYRRE
jgi:hypothetical protein